MGFSPSVDPGVPGLGGGSLPRCRPGSAEPLTRALTSLPHFSPEGMGRKAAFFTPTADPGGAEALGVSLGHKS